MLALTRKAGQSIILGDDIEIIVVEVKGDQVRLGIKAPKSVSIYRKELYEEIQFENRAAATPDPKTLDTIGNVLNDAVRQKKNSGEKPE